MNYRCKLTDTAEVCFVCHQLSTAITVADNNSFAALYDHEFDFATHWRVSGLQDAQGTASPGRGCVLLSRVLHRPFYFPAQPISSHHRLHATTFCTGDALVTSLFPSPPPGTWCGHRARHRAQGTKKGYSHERTAEQSGINSLLHREAI